MSELTVATTDALGAVLELHAAPPDEAPHPERAAQLQQATETAAQWRAQLPNGNDAFVAADCDNDQQ
jgi:hypothetical protein